MNEEWKPVKGYEDLYLVSSYGKIKHIKKDKCRKLRPNKRGYVQVNLSKENIIVTKSVHRLVAEVFIPNPERKTSINHIDGDKTNNKADNLEWCTTKENINHAIVTGLRNNSGANNSQSKTVANCRNQVFSTGKEAARYFNIKSSSNITKACKGIIPYSGKYEDGSPITWTYKECYGKEGLDTGRKKSDDTSNLQE